MGNVVFYLLLIVLSGCIAWISYDILARLMRVVRYRDSKYGKRTSHFTETNTGGDFQGLYQSLRKTSAKNLRMNAADHERISADLLRLGSTHTTSYVRFTQFTLAGIMVVIAFIFFFIFKPLAFIGIILAFYGFNYPVLEIRAKIRKMNAAVELEFPDFYRSVYFAYRRKINVPLLGVVRSAMREASPEFRQELSILASNITTMGEIAALKEWKKALPLAYITRFCDYLEARLSGEKNEAVMESFKIELDNARQEERQRVLARMEKNLTMVNEITVVPFFLIIIVYLIAQISGSGFMDTFK